VRCDVGDGMERGFSGNREVGYEGVVMGSSALGIQNLDGEPVENQSILAIAQRNLGQPAKMKVFFFPG